jgi:hypothetical protein
MMADLVNDAMVMAVWKRNQPKVLFFTVTEAASAPQIFTGSPSKPVVLTPA